MHTKPNSTYNIQLNSSGDDDRTTKIDLFRHSVYAFYTICISITQFTVMFNVSEQLRVQYIYFRAKISARRLQFLIWLHLN